MKEVNFYDSQYGHLTASVQTDIRRETYGEDLGQASWITLREALEWFQRLGLGPGQKALEVACGSGGVALRMARETGSSCVGVDINVHGIDAANQLAAREGMASLLSFQVVDAAGLDPLLHAVGLFLGDRPVVELGLDLVECGRLGCVLELLARDAELLGDPVEERGARVAAARGDCRAGTRDGETGDERHDGLA